MNLLAYWIDGQGVKGAVKMGVRRRKTTDSVQREHSIGLIIFAECKATIEIV